MTPAPSPQATPLPARRRRLRDAALQAAGIALAAGLAAWMVLRLDDRAALAGVFREALARPAWLAAGLAALGVSLACGTLRWALLLRAFAVPLPALETARLYLAGHFLSIFAAGSTGGDVAKAAIVAARFPGRRLRAVLSIVVERIVGLLSLALPLAALLPALPRAFRAGAGLCALALGAALAAFCALALLPGPAGARPAHHPRLRRLAAPWALCRDALRGDRAALRGAVALSIANHAVAALCGAALARAAGAAVPLAPATAAMLLANAVALLPVTPGGLGLRESCAAALLVSLGADETRATAAGLLLFGAILAWAAVGALAWIALPAHRNQQFSF